jgi:Flp pilus assembly protein TadG
MRSVRHVCPPGSLVPAPAPRQRERGAVLVEFALVAMLLCLLLAGVFDYGWAWRAGLATNEGVRTAARVGSGQAKNPGADYFALNGLRSAMSASGKLDDVDKVVIFRSTTANGRVPTSCLAGSPTGTCNVLTGAQLRNLSLNSFNLTIDANNVATGTGCMKSGVALRNVWCPTSRSNNQDTGADYYGVYMAMTYEHEFPLLGGDTKVSRTAVMRLEPTSFGS